MAQKKVNKDICFGYTVHFIAFNFTDAWHKSIQWHSLYDLQDNDNSSSSSIKKELWQHVLQAFLIWLSETCYQISLSLSNDFNSLKRNTHHANDLRQGEKKLTAKDLMQLVCFFMAWTFQRKFLLRRTKTVTFQTKSCTHVGIPYSNCDGNLSVFLFNYENWRRVRDAFFAASRKFQHSILQSHAMTTNVSTMNAELNIVVFGWVLIIKFRQKLDENMIRMVIVSSSLALSLFTWKFMFKMWSKQINATKPWQNGNYVLRKDSFIWYTRTV